MTNNQPSQVKIKKHLFPRYNDAAGLCDLCLLTLQAIYREHLSFPLLRHSPPSNNSNFTFIFVLHTSYEAVIALQLKNFC